MSASEHAPPGEGARALEALVARLLDVEARVRASRPRGRFGLPPRAELVWRTALVLALAPPGAGRHELGGGVDPWAIEPLGVALGGARGGAREADDVEHLVADWAASAMTLRARSSATSPLRSTGRFVAAALGLAYDLRPREFGEALVETLTRFREAHLRGPARALAIAAALLVCEGARTGTGVVPTFVRVRRLPALAAEMRARGRAFRDGRDLCASALGAEDETADIGAEAAARSDPALSDPAVAAAIHAQLAGAARGLRAATLDTLVASLVWGAAGPAEARRARAPRVAALVALHAG